MPEPMAAEPANTAPPPCIGEEEQPPNAAFPVTEEVKRMAEAANAAREQGRKEAEKTWAAYEASWMQISPGVAAPQDLIGQWGTDEIKSWPRWTLSAMIKSAVEGESMEMLGERLELFKTSRWRPSPPTPRRRPASARGSSRRTTLSRSRRR